MFDHFLITASYDIEIHETDVDAALKTYDVMSKGNFIHATSSLYNAGTLNSQVSSHRTRDGKFKNLIEEIHE